MDLRYCIPPVLTLILSLFLSPSNSDGDSLIFVRKYSIIELPFLFVALFFVLPFLFISADLPLNLNLIWFRTGDFSIAVTASLLASLFFPPSLFWPFHFFILLSYPCHGLLFDLFKHLFRWFHAFLHSLPTWSFSFTRNEESSSSPSPLHVGDMEENPTYVIRIVTSNEENPSSVVSRDFIV
ncbi:hypothetical protein ES288_D13G093700v1 [Gossypium darwinii]|uniref:Uncharacterized protein n=1 Tax=Gossypium darwinii TaxID=34276 RepID=A0A5D1ZVZ5_GOSDA|nr:hypothetical protein ES288_D13G093700v1 [Gossypium darwinii]